MTAKTLQSYRYRDLVLDTIKSTRLPAGYVEEVLDRAFETLREKADAYAKIELAGLGLLKIQQNEAGDTVGGKIIFRID